MVLQMEQIRNDIRDFQLSSGVDKVIVLWTANTERFCEVVPGVNDSAENLLAAIQVLAEANTSQHNIFINRNKKSTVSSCGITLPISNCTQTSIRIHVIVYLSLCLCSDLACATIGPLCILRREISNFRCKSSKKSKN